ncbi:MAG: polysaccharide biosynthesis protein, partial [Burkholderiales bacterium]|nr:polysaccharide biosynthesis protein [Burkholderiales bacterium]
IRLSGLGEDEIRITYTGLRPGEKLYEEVLAADENSLATPHPKLRVAKARTTDDGLLALFDQWLSGAGQPGATEVKRQLSAWIPEYQAHQS